MSLVSNQICDARVGDLPGELAEASEVSVTLQERVYFEITPFCNLTCIHCSSLTDGFKEMLTVNEVVEAYLALKQLGAKSAVVTGGEPFVHRDCIEILGKLAAIGPVVVTTNGTVLPIPKLTALLNQYPHLLIQFSWDGVTKATFEIVRGKGVFDKASKALHSLIEQGFADQVALSMTVMSVNFHEVEEIFQFALEHGIHYVHLPNLLPVGRARTRWTKLALSSDQLYWVCQTVLSAAQRYAGQLHISSNLLRRVYARSAQGSTVDCLNRYMIKIGPTGLIMPCPAASDPRLALGNIRSFNLAKDLLPTLQAQRPELVVHAYRERTVCHNCRWYQVCGARFCENCGLLSASPHELAVESMCQVSQKLYHECALAFNSG